MESMQQRKPLIIAHRGASAYVLENTIDAFALAIRQGARVLEMDIRQTSDGVIIIRHGTALRKRLRRFLVRKVTLAKLMELTGGNVTLLEDVIKRFSKKAILDFDIKDKHLIAELVRLIRRYRLKKEQFMIDSSKATILEQVRIHLPDARLVLSYALSDSADLSKRKMLQRVIATLSRSVNHILPIRFKRRAVKKKFYGVSLPYSFVYKKLVDYFHNHGLRVYAWPPEGERTLKRLIRLEVDGIKTPRPDLLAELIHEI